MNSSLPIIGITADYECPENNYPRYFLKAPYVNSIRDAGAIVVILPFPSGNNPHEPDEWDFLDGILLSGSGPDIPPEFYGREKEIGNNPWMVRERVLFEQALLRKSEQDKTPLLGICGGLQALNVYRGGTLIQDIPSMDTPVLDHQTPHSVLFDKKSPILPWLAEGEYRVNSFHHQAIDQPGEKLEIIGRSPDGIIEALLDLDHPFLMAVQWHPERHLEGDLLSSLILKHFVDACRVKKQTHFSL